MADDKPKLKVESGGRPTGYSDYLPPPPPPVDEITPMSGYKSYLDPTTPGAQATFDSYFWNTPPLGLDLTYEGYQRKQRLAAGDGSSGSSAGETVPVLTQAEVTPTPTEIIGGGGGVSGPDYSAYRAALTDQAQQINAQIQAMYNALGEEAGANVGRIQDIYGGASTGIGDVYDSAAANTAAAYGSSQQQAADQLARLGIEAAAPAVVNPMALSQAEALAGLEQGRAGGQAATERFGSAASGFGSQMAQVAQQQGTEINAAVLNALQNRLNDTLLMEEQGRQAAAQASAAGPAGPSFRDQLAEQQFAFDVAQAAADTQNRRREQNRELLLSLILPQEGQNPIYDLATAKQLLNALESEGY